MKLRYKDPRGRRFMYGYRWMEPVSSFLMFCETRREWVDPTVDCGCGGEHSSSAWCRTPRAFRRLLKKCPAGVSFRLVSKYQGVGDVLGKGTLKPRVLVPIPLKNR